mgnify:CR=1 FL=1
MKEMDCVEVIVEKEKYAKEGVYKGMQGWICYDKKVRGIGWSISHNMVQRAILQH